MLALLAGMLGAGGAASAATSVHGDLSGASTFAASAAANPNLNGTWQLYTGAQILNGQWLITSGTSTTITGYGGSGGAVNGPLSGSISDGSGQLLSQSSGGFAFSYVITSVSGNTMMTGFQYYESGPGLGSPPQAPSSYGECEAEQQANPDSGWFCREITAVNLTPSNKSARSSATVVSCTRAASGEISCAATVTDSTGDGTVDTPTGPVTFSASAGSFAAPTCELSAVPGGAACSARYTPPPPKDAPPSVSVTARYPTDSTFSGSVGMTLLKCAVLVGGCNSVSGRVTTLECKVTECEGHAPREPVTVVARSGEDSFSAITKPDGKYTIGDLHAGSWRITPQLDRPTMVSEPKSRDIKFNEAAPDTRGGVDFSVCDKDPQPGANDGCLPEFDYAMPARYGDSELTKSYADPDHFTVTFTIRDGNCDRKATYAWFADGNPLKVEPTADKCQFEARFDALGTYRVRVDQSGSAGSNRQLSFVKKISVKDFLVAAIGDSLASGEGSPTYKEQPLFIGCDRSLRAYDSQSALKLELSDPRSSVTFLQLACSGAAIVAKKNTTFSRSDNSTLDQLEQLKRLIGDRKIDALTISVGINDTDFGSLLAICVERFHCGDLDTVDHYAEKLDLLPSLYDELHDQITELFSAKQLDSKDIYFVGYPDPLYASPGDLCPVMISNGSSPTSLTGGGFENIGGEDEVTWAQEHFMTPLTLAGQRAADRFGWNYINLDAPDSPFQSHGYCNPSRWFNTVEDFKAGKVNFDGILHPTPAGQTSIAHLLTPRLLANLVPDA